MTSPGPARRQTAKLTVPRRPTGGTTIQPVAEPSRPLVRRCASDALRFLADDRSRPPRKGSVVKPETSADWEVR